MKKAVKQMIDEARAVVELKLQMEALDAAQAGLREAGVI